MTQSIDPLAPQPTMAAAPVMPAAPTGTAQVPAVPQGYGAPAAYGAHLATGAPGKIRGTGVCILLAIITLGIYTAVWYYKVHNEMKQHSGQGLGGGVALLLALFVGFVMPYLTAGEVGGLYERAGKQKPVSGVTGLWYFPGSFLIVGPLVWFVKTNGALNAYWRSQGVAA